MLPSAPPLVISPAKGSPVHEPASSSQAPPQVPLVPCSARSTSTPALKAVSFQADNKNMAAAEVMTVPGPAQLQDAKHGLALCHLREAYIWLQE